MTVLLYQPRYGPSGAVVAVIPLAVAALACFLPARRASRTDPVAALQHE
jgi:ABC-type lipoprotein release transport system permease subunit